MSESPKPRRLGDFELVKELGSGGMGTVWEAVQMSLGRRVALKLLAPHISMSATALQRFQREAEAGARINHPHIVSVYQVGEEDGVHYIAQELVVGGKSLSDEIEHLRKSTELPASYYEKTAELFAQIADALHVAHEAGIIHRDVKPANILMAEGGVPKVSDFGLAQVEDALELSRSGEFAGTPFYMSPEQAMSKRIGIDHRTDVFSLGVTLWEALALQRPFEGDTSQQVLQKILTTDPPDPRTLRSRCPRDLAVICTKAIEKDPARRFTTMEELADDLRRFLASKPIKARPPNLKDKVIKWAKRHPVASTSGSVASILLTLAAVLFFQGQAAQAEAAAKSVAIERLLESFGGFLDEADPALARGEAFDTEKFLRKAALSVSRELANQPLARANLLRRIAAVHFNLGESQRCVELAKESLDLYEREGETQAFGPINSQELLGLAHSDLGELELARKHLQIAKDGYDNLYGPEHLLSLNASANLSINLQRKGDLAESEREMLRVFAGRRQQLGANHLETLRALGNLGAFYLIQCRYREAEANTREAYAGTQELLGKDHPDAIYLQANLTSILLRQSRTDEAIELLEEAVPIGRRVLGEEHTLYWNLTFNQGYAHLQNGNLAEAAPLYLSALENYRGLFPESHPVILFFESYWGELIRRKGETAKAASLLTRILEQQREQLGSNHPDLEQTIYYLALTRKDQGLKEEALDLAEKLVGMTPEYRWEITQRRELLDQLKKMVAEAQE